MQDIPIEVAKEQELEECMQEVVVPIIKSEEGHSARWAKISSG